MAQVTLELGRSEGLRVVEKLGTGAEHQLAVTALPVLPGHSQRVLVYGAIFEDLIGA